VPVLHLFQVKMWSCVRSPWRWPWPGVTEVWVLVVLQQGRGCLSSFSVVSLTRTARDPPETPLPHAGSADPAPPLVTELLPLPIPSNSSAESLDRLYPAVGSTKPPRKRTTSQCKSEPPLLRTSKRTIYTAGRPPWYNEHGTQSKEAFVIGGQRQRVSGLCPTSELQLAWGSMGSVGAACLEGLQQFLGGISASQTPWKLGVGSRLQAVSCSARTGAGGDPRVSPALTG